ncbi:MAG: zinc ribbon domain-containing protein [Sinobacteraceae bacterium]|nr:zinc ribbon domain-containing protein [Nevskiaceae bacterium]MCP5473121.1 zinc ribbon domain-containing protein [Nevskiaceae bacterium]
MPFYEYECSSCKYYTEVLQKISDSPLRKCPSCGKSTFKKLISAPVFRLKGSGWYETDFKSDKENKRNLAGGEREESRSDDKKEAASSSEAPKSEPAKAEAAKPAAAKPGGDKPAARPRRSRAAAKAKAPSRATAKSAKKKARR